MKETNEDKYFKELLSYSALEMPFSDFDHEVMKRIRAENKSLATFKRNIRLSWMFFVLGTIFGITLTLFLSDGNHVLFGTKVGFIEIIFQLVFIIFFLLGLEYLIRMSRIKMNKELKKLKDSEFGQF